MGLYRREDSTNWWYKFKFKKRLVQESSGTSNREEAEQVEALRKRELFEEHRLGVKPSKLWNDAVAEYVSTLPEGRNKEQTKAELRWFDQYLGGRALKEIDQDLLLQVRRARAALVEQRAGQARASGYKPRSERASPGHLNRVMGIARAVLHHAVDLKWLDSVPVLHQVPDRKRAPRFITREQAEKLLAELPDHQARMVIFALETGLRRGNVTHLKWVQVDLARRLAWVNPEDAKGGVGIPVPLSDTAVRVLEQQQGLHDDYVFVYRGGPVYQTSTRAWRAALARAGIENFTWHGLRHTWASWHRQDGTPTLVLKELGGWKDDRMPGNYAHLGADHLTEYVGRRTGLVATKVDTVLKSKARKKEDKRLM